MTPLADGVRIGLSGKFFGVILALAGRNTVLGNLAGVVFGVFMYFPPLVEVPIAKMFLGLGMHRGPLLAYLMTDPELSLQSILVVSTIIGKVKAWTYVVWVALFSMAAGLLYGAWVDGASPWLIVAGALVDLALLARSSTGWLHELRMQSPRNLPRSEHLPCEAGDLP